MNEQNFGKTMHSWTVPEYHQHERGKWWYIIAASLAVASIVYALYTKNFLFAFIIIILAVIIFLHHTSEPADVRVTMTELGLMINDKFYRFRDISSFWIIYEPPLTKNLYFQLAESFRPPFVISLADEDPLTLRRTLLQYVAEDLDKKEEPLSDLLWRLLKL
jgi:hypothetical protein